MGCCLSKKPLSSGTSQDPVKPDDVNKPTKPVIELPVKPVIELREEVQKEEENATSKKTESVVRSSSCTKEEVDAILIQCGKLSKSNSTRRYSASKRSFDFDHNERTREATPQRVNGSPRQRRRRSVATNPNPKGSLVTSSNVKFVTVNRSIKESCRTAASPARAAVQPPPPPSRKLEKSPYRRRNPLGEIDQNARKGDKKMIKREKESAKLQVISRSSPVTLLQSKEEDKSNYTALLLKDIKNFHGESHDDEDPLSLLPPCVTKACSIVDAVADLNSNTCLSSNLNRFRFTSTVKYVTVRRGCSLEEQESSCG